MLTSSILDFVVSARLEYLASPDEWISLFGFLFILSIATNIQTHFLNFFKGFLFLSFRHFTALK